MSEQVTSSVVEFCQGHEAKQLPHRSVDSIVAPLLKQRGSECCDAQLASGMGQYAKSSLRADVFRFAPQQRTLLAAYFMGDFDYRAGGRSPR
jgi:hypothetical protein